ncbi:MAG: peroxiredoxin-like family protein [Proteobacteria bacterium]|nr:peroxiredoxin-like family protein [Pseudomonadota bacterium]
MDDEAPRNPAFEAARALDAPLAERLAAYSAASRARSPVVAEAYDAFVDTLERAKAGSEVPGIGAALPAFMLSDTDGRPTSMAELLADGPLVVSFNRGGWCPFCWLELSALADIDAAVREVGGSIVSIVPDTAVYGRRLRARLSLPFPVLTDLDNGYGLELGLTVAMPADLRVLFLASGMDLGVFQKNDGWFIPIPATLVVDRAGILRARYVDVEFRRRIDPRILPGLVAEAG